MGYLRTGERRYDYEFDHEDWLNLMSHEQEHGTRTIHSHSELLNRRTLLLLSHCIEDPAKKWN